MMRIPLNSMPSSGFFGFCRRIRFWAAVAVVLCITALGVALFTQTQWGWAPCPLCILQRYAYGATALGFLLFVLKPKTTGLMRFNVLWATLCVVLGAWVALYHVWVLSNPAQTCGIDPLQVTLNNLPWVGLWPALFEADGLCTEPGIALLGVALPLWSALGFAVLALVLLRVVTLGANSGR
jgi:disulfide bond formation protein DsbB